MLIPFLISAAMFGISVFAQWAFHHTNPALFFASESILVNAISAGLLVIWLFGSCFGIIAGFGGLIVTTSQKVDKRGKFRPRKNAYGRFVAKLITSGTTMSLCQASALCGFLSAACAAMLATACLLVYMAVFHTMSFLEFFGFMAGVTLLTFGGGIAIILVLQWRKKYAWVKELTTLLAGLALGGSIIYIAPTVAGWFAGGVASSIPSVENLSFAPVIAAIVFFGVVGLAAGAVYLAKQFLKRMPFYTLVCPVSAKLRSKVA